MTLSVFATSKAKNRNQGSTATEIRLMDPGWWPTKATAPRDQYVGSAVCRHCHKDIVPSQSSTPMALALRPVTGDPMRFMGGTYSVTKGQQAATANLAWIFGFARGVLS